MGSSALVRGSLKLRTEVGLPEVRAAIGGFCDTWRIKLGETGDRFGLLAPVPDEENPFDENDVELREDHWLALYLLCAMRAGYPKGFEELCTALEPLVGDSGATLEVIDLDASPSNDDAVCPVFLGDSDEVRLKARMNYAFERAWALVSEEVPREVFEAARESCEAAARKALAEARFMRAA